MPSNDRYLIAILPPSPISDEVRKLKEYFRDKYHSKASLNSPAHITMHMPFEWRTDRESQLITALERFCSDQKQFPIDLIGFGSFHGSVVFIDVGKNAPLEDCQDRLFRFCKTELNIFNALYRDQPFHPHITLAFRDLKKTEFAEAWKEFETKEYRETFVCDELTLLKHDGRYWSPLRGLEIKR